MKRCLCCGKSISIEAYESNHGWHRSCIKNFFNTSKIPDIDISEEVIRQIAVASTSKGFTVPGVQKKLSLHLSNDDEPRLTLVNYPTGFILKPQTEEYPALPEMEYLVMKMAQISNIKTVPFALLQLSEKHNNFAYITKRIDRINNQMLAMEDFCQLDGRLTEDKYRSSYERCGKIVSRYCSENIIDLTELYQRIVFSFIVGNSDMHLKNFSLIETAEGSNQYALSAAYDMLSTNVVIPADNDQFALTLNGKKRNIRKKDFLIFADTIGISNNSADMIILKMIRLKTKYIEMCEESYLPQHMKDSLIQLIRQRIDTLSS